MSKDSVVCVSMKNLGHRDYSFSPLKELGKLYRNDKAVKSCKVIILKFANNFRLEKELFIFAPGI